MDRNNDFTCLYFSSKPVFENAFEVPWHDNLVDLVEWISSIIGDKDKLPTLTCTYRPGDKKTHGTNPLRSIDLRSRGYNYQLLVDTINRHWQYDKTRPKIKVAIFHDVGRGPHVHLQVHDNTEIINGGWGVTDIC